MGVPCGPGSRERRRYASPPSASIPDATDLFKPNVVSSGEILPIRYTYGMSRKTKTLLEQVESWPEEDQEELADLAREIAARRAGVYLLSDDERLAVREGMDAARRGDFAPDDEVEEFYKLHRRI